ncbi:hypothetical protein [Chryseobacterium sp.]|uniref:hypothetical protein n=1 Tax=Chryseobacterium sp. TaxID=1871047 RepID=UPI0025BDF8DD|nr:hypothetical protein [Chryseobacterium sp.]MBV8325047.1 hypothetical protein [Chryseobacterium sp.]
MQYKKTHVKPVSFFLTDYIKSKELLQIREGEFSIRQLSDAEPALYKSCDWKPFRRNQQCSDPAHLLKLSLQTLNGKNG